MPEKETVEMYKYIRDGKEYWTSNEELANKRSDTGEYYVYTETVKK
jgi:YHS domain-containing protein